ncbi:glutathione S-transferase theta-1-like isoform X2 [Drosophila pseudoobscura]|uniref:Glutathione S-transferase theta-1-like isoform X1 n=1 Tax=Drosophila pseudoobscura pseudoobscura TaxID=46245 RepID=A0A6I8VVK5_DROPS|nr:glutathione S-transferase theta-1 isoform X1 [Drosophila pseudoobscura]XP_033235112.1 glutathione S-transferase theta-1 isoform X2 [Drosophila pseudoobscura]
MPKPIQLYYDFLSPPSRALWIALKWGRTPFEDCPIALRKFEQLTDEYKNINRFQKVPAIVDGNFHLAETVAIVRYLSDKGQFSNQLYPRSVEERARVDEYLEWQHLNIRLACSVFFREAWLFPINGLAPVPKPEQIQQLIKDVEINLGLLEVLWLEKDYLIGDHLTLADLFGATEINQIKLCQYNVNEKQFPKVAKWLERVRNATNPYHDEALTFVYKKAKQAASAKL